LKPRPHLTREGENVLGGHGNNDTITPSKFKERKEKKRKKGIHNSARIFLGCHSV
jgi:hypothetical protein